MDEKSAVIKLTMSPSVPMTAESNCLCKDAEACKNASKHVETSTFPTLRQFILFFLQKHPDRQGILVAEKSVKDVMSVDAGIDKIQLQQYRLSLFNEMESKSHTPYNDTFFSAQDFISEQRTLLYYADVQWPNSKRNPADVSLLLFNDVIVFLQRNNEQTNFFTQDGKAGVVSVRNMIVREKAGKLGSDGCYLVATMPKPELYEVRCKMRKENDRLMNEIQKAAKIYAKVRSVGEKPLPNSLHEKDQQDLLAIFKTELGHEIVDNIDSSTEEDFTDMAERGIIDLIGDDKAGHLVVVGYAYRLPNNRSFDHEKFLRYLMNTLNRFVEQDYTIVYFHYGYKIHNKPPLRWLFRAYELLDRKYKKNLKAFYLVHPTRFIKIVWNMFHPLISMKFERKMNYVNYLFELREQLHVDNFVVPADIECHDRALRLYNKVNNLKTLPTDSGARPSPTQQFGVNLVSIFATFSKR